MAHNIAAIGGRPAMMYTGEPPWHGLGTRLNAPATAAEAMHAARLDWEVTKAPLLVNTGLECPVIEDKWAIMRVDKGKPVLPVLGIVGEGYTPLQNGDAFAWFDSIVGQGAAIYHTAGVLGGGERIWILAKLPDTIRVAGEDDVGKYLLLANSHDGQSSVQVKFTPVRVVCQNTLTLALSLGKAVRVQHTASLHQRLDQAKTTLGIIQRCYTLIAENFQRLALVQMNKDRLEQFLAAVFPAPRVEEEKALPTPSAPDTAAAEKESPSAPEEDLPIAPCIAEAGRLFEEGLGNNSAHVRGTLWAAYNGVTEYVDHYAPHQSEEGRLNSIWFGSGYLAKARAYRLAVEFADKWKN